MWWTCSTVSLTIVLFLLKPFHCQVVGISCSVNTSNESGICKLLSECKQVRDDILTQQRLPQLCGFRQTQPIVCCPQEKRKPGDISKKKCKEYSAYAKNECGLVIVKRIIGGEFAENQEFPHMALLGFEKVGSAEIQWRCGGIIISDRYILTVAHCLLNTRGFDLKYVKVGVTDLNETDHQQQIRVLQTVAHPDYNPSLLKNDIGLIKLEKPIELNSYARPACLYTQREVTVDVGVVSGWGVTETGFISNKLKKVELPFVSSNLCDVLFQKHSTPNPFDKDIQICAGTANKDSCQGDTGGPLQIKHEGNDILCMYDIVGVSSAGARVCGSAPGMYTRVSHYVQWIEDIVWPEK